MKKMRKIALPLAENKLSPHFGNCQHFAFYTITDQSIKESCILPAPVHQPGVIPDWLVDQEVTDVIANGIGQRAIELFNIHKINVFVGAQVKPPEDLVKDYLEGILETNGNLCNH